jgi:long-chain acyl-CoA synthetase
MTGDGAGGGGRRETLVPYVLDGLAHRHASFASRETFRIRRLSTPELVRLACRFGHELDARGLRKGDRLLAWGTASPEWVAAFLGALLRGVVVVPLEDAGGVELARAVARRVEPRLAVVGRSSLAEARAALGEGTPLLVLEELGERLAARPDHPPPAVELSPADPVEILFTSGTTSRPKGVVLSHRNLLQNLQALEPLYRRWEPRLRWLRRRPIVSVLPLSHAFGQVVGIFAPLLMRLSPTFVPAPSPTAVREAIVGERALVAVTVPRVLTGLRRLLEQELERAGELSAHLARRRRLPAARAWRRLLAFGGVRRRLGRRFLGFVVGGAALPEAEEAAWRAMGYLVVQGYGLTETAPIVAVSTPFSRAAGAVGRTLGDQEVRLAPDGEVLVRGENVAEGYLVDGGVQPLTDEEGWFHTGDLGELDERGRLRIRGRSKDVIVSSEGLNVFPRDVEAALGEQPGVREAAVIGRPGAEGETVHAVLLLEPRLRGAPDDERARAAAEAVETANRRLSPHQRVRSHSTWPAADFPRTPGTGKVLKRELLQAPEPGAADDGGVESVLRAFLDRDARLDGDRRLADLDLSSLDVLELLGRLEAEAELSLDETAIGSQTTVAELRRHLTEGPAREGGRVRPPMPRWARGRLARLAGALLRAVLAAPVLLVACRLRVEGHERLVGLSGPALFVGNHASYLDAPVAFRALPGRIRHRVATAMATEPFDPLFTTGGGRWQRARQRLRYALAVLAFNAFPLPRAAGFRASLAYAAELVDRGHDVLVFPEGRMSPDGRLQPFRGGIGLLATRLGVPVVPFRIDGLHAVLPAEARWPRRGPVRVRFGEPLRIDADAEPAAVVTRLERAVRGA